MLKRSLLILFVSLLVPVTAFSQSSDWTKASSDAYSWLVSQTFSTSSVIDNSGQPAMPENGLIVDSFENGVEKNGWGEQIAVCFTYDQAVAVIAYLLKDDTARAEGILATMRALQLQQRGEPKDDGISHEGSWYTAYQLTWQNGTSAGAGDSPWKLYGWEWKRHVGPAMWMAIAAMCFEKETGDTSYRQMAVDALEWARQFWHPRSEGGRGHLTGGWEYHKPEGWCSTEFNIDAYVAYKFFGETTGNPTYLTVANDIKHFIDNVVWDETHKRIYTGYTMETDSIVPDLAMDVHPWTVLAMGIDGNRRYADTLEWVESSGLYKHPIDGITLYDFDWGDPDDHWYEGSAFMSLAHFMAGHTILADEIIDRIIHFQIKEQDPLNTKGGVPYSRHGTFNKYWAMEHHPAVSSTGWLIMAIDRYNPFTGERIISASPPWEPTPVTPVSDPPSPRPRDLETAARKAMEWLDRRLIDSSSVIGIEGARIIDSFSGYDSDIWGNPLIDVCFTYDQAVAAIAYMVKGGVENLDKAEGLLDTLKTAQSWEKDIHAGSLLTAYRYRQLERWSEWWEEQYEDEMWGWEWNRHVGPVMWVVIAAMVYEKTTGNTSYYRQMAVDALNWAKQFVQPSGSLSGGWGYDDLPESFTSTEFNLDAYVAYKYFGEAAGNSEFLSIAERIKQFLDTEMWNDRDGRFFVGWRENTQSIDPDPMMDVNLWGILALGLEYERALDWVETSNLYKTTLNGVTLYDFDFDADDHWYEGSAFVSLAHYMRGDQGKADEILQDITRFQDQGGGVPYSNNGTHNTYWKMEYRPSVAATAWLVLAIERFNPFIGTRLPDIPSTSPHPDPQADALYWLKEQSIDTTAFGPPGKQSILVDSFEGWEKSDNNGEWDHEEPMQSVSLYDQSIAAIAFMLRGDLGQATGILNALEFLQEKEGEHAGSWYTMYQVFTNDDGLAQGTSEPDVPTGVWGLEYRRHVGPMAWVLMAIRAYEELTGDKTTYRQMAINTLEYMKRFKQPSGALSGGWSWDNLPEVFTSAEFNMDAYGVYEYFGKETGNVEYMSIAAGIKEFLTETMWNDRDGHFHVGWREDSQTIDTDPMMDVNPWGVLSLGSDYARAVKWVEDSGLYGKGIDGVTLYDFDFDADDHWYEGSAFVALAYLMLGNEEAHADILSRIAHFQTKPGDRDRIPGGIPYSHYGTHNGYWQMENRPSVSSTAWLIIAQEGFNPFIGEYINDPSPPDPEPGFDHGTQEAGENSLLVWFLPDEPAEGVDIEVVVNNGGMDGHGMVPTGEGRHEHIVEGLLSGDRVHYRFSYTDADTGAVITEWFDYEFQGVTPPEPGAEYEAGMEAQGADKALAWFASSIGSDWVDLQVVRGGGPVTGYRMTRANGDRHEHVLSAVDDGETIQYRFVFQKDAVGQAVTEWSEFTYSEDGSPDPPPEPPPDPPPEPDAEYEAGIEDQGSGRALAWFTSAIGSDWVDVQVVKGGGPVTGYRMTRANGDRHEYVLSGLDDGETIQYRFVYHKDAMGQAVTEWSEFTYSGDVSPDPPPDPPPEPDAEYEAGIEDQGSGRALAWFTSSIGSDWVDLQVVKGGGPVTGYRMTHVNGDRHEHVLSGFGDGETIQYRFVFQKDGGSGQVVSIWYSYQF